MRKLHEQSEFSKGMPLNVIVVSCMEKKVEHEVIILIHTAWKLDWSQYKKQMKSLVP